VISSVAQFRAIERIILFIVVVLAETRCNVVASFQTLTLSSSKGVAPPSMLGAAGASKERSSPKLMTW
jgi:hypothetical protein